VERAEVAVAESDSLLCLLLPLPLVRKAPTASLFTIARQQPIVGRAGCLDTKAWARSGPIQGSIIRKKAVDLLTMVLVNVVVGLESRNEAGAKS